MLNGVSHHGRQYTGCARYHLDESLMLLRFKEIKTNIADDLPSGFAAEFARWPEERWKSADQGCATTLVAAFDPELSGEWRNISILRYADVNIDRLARGLTSRTSPGSSHIYLEDCQPARPARWAADPEKAERLWRLSENLTAPSSKL